MSGAQTDLASLPRETFWRTLTTFTVTRILIALLLLVYLSLNSSKPFGDTEQLLYWETCIAYVLMSLLFAALATFHRRNFLWQLAAQITGDIVVVSILYIAAGGGRSGLAILYLFPLAGGAILAPLLVACFFVAVVTLILLSESGYALLEATSETTVSQAGLYGAAFFVAVFAINRLAARLIKQEELAAERGRQLRLQESINRLVIADMGDGILVVRRDGTVLTSNPAADRMLGLAFSRGGQRLTLSEHPTLAPIADAFSRWTLQPGAGLEGDAEQAATFVQVKPLAEVGHAAPASAWAGRRELSAHLKLRFARVEADRMAQDRSIIFMQDVSEIDNQAQQLKLASMGRLTASIAHEVRNPLSAISYSASLLLEESVDPGQTRLLRIVVDNVTRLNRMIEDILRLSRKVHRPDEPLALAPTIASIVAEFIETHGVPDHLIRVAPMADHRVWFDGMHLQEVLLNLLSNALRYASGQPGSIRIDILPVSAARLELHVQDDGASISQEVRAHLFEPFYTTSSKGTGLGLYLARELCLNNGAVLDYEYRADILDRVDDADQEWHDAEPGSAVKAVEPSGRFVITFATAART
jgi:two-component system sensor histidine kinase PilS (NtrC family)